MIRLTRIDYDGNKKPITIDAESIESIEDGEKRTELTTKRGWTFYVVESRDEVARKVVEYQQAVAKGDWGKLRELSGLEE